MLTSIATKNKEIGTLYSSDDLRSNEIDTQPLYFDYESNEPETSPLFDYKAHYGEIFISTTVGNMKSPYKHKNKTEYTKIGEGNTIISGEIQLFDHVKNDEENVVLWSDRGHIENSVSDESMSNQKEDGSISMSIQDEINTENIISNHDLDNLLLSPNKKSSTERYSSNDEVEKIEANNSLNYKDIKCTSKSTDLDDPKIKQYVNTTSEITRL